MTLEGAPLRSRLVILAVTGAAMAMHFWPAAALRKWAWGALGSPSYSGPYILIEHAFLASTLGALACALAWWQLVRMKLLPPPPLAIGRGPVLWGLAAGAASLAIFLAFFLTLSPEAIGYIAPNGWKIAGNLFSNFYEELIWRGLLLAALTAVFGFWPAAVISSIAFGLVHTQYPLPIQGMVAVVGFVWCVALRQSKSLWAPYIAHTSADVAADSLIG